jgi:hypothetical protein
MNSEALAVGVAQVIAVAFYLYLGARLLGRRVSSPSRLPAVQFSVFWFGVGISAATSAALSLIAAFQTPSLALETGLLYANLLIVSLALWGLLCYLVFLYTGRSATLPLSILYSVEFALLVYYVATRGVVGVSVVDGVVGPVYGPASTGALGVIAVLLLVFPEFVGALAYFRLFFQAREPTVRYRIALVSWGLVGYFLLALGNPGTLFGGGLVGAITGHVVLLLAVFAIAIAYYPPATLRKRYGVMSIEESIEGPPSDPP